MLSGAGAPAETLGVTGSGYVDTSSWVLYGPKQASAVNVGPVPSALARTVQMPTTSVQHGSGADLGIRFSVNVPGYVNGVSFFKPTASIVAARNVRLWNSAGVQLALGTSTAEVGGNWHTALFAAPSGFRPAPTPCRPPT